MSDARSNLQGKSMLRERLMWIAWPAFLVAAGGLGWFAWRPVQGWPALAAAAAFLVLHAVIHVFDASCSSNPMSDLIRDLPGVYLPAALAAALAISRRPGA